jgi:hypothetical protein
MSEQGRDQNQKFEAPLPIWFFGTLQREQRENIVKKPRRISQSFLNVPLKPW